MTRTGLRAILFDAGNTLVFPRLDDLARDLTVQGYPATVEDFHAAERAGKQKLDEWLWPLIRKCEVPRHVDPYYWSEYLHTLMERIGAPEAERAKLIRQVADGFRSVDLWSYVLPGTSEYLESLRAQHYCLGVISNSVGTIEEQLTRVGLAQHFQTIVDSALVGVEKPHPEIFQIALAQVGVERGEAVFVGDTYATDMGGAQLAGLRGVLLDRVGAYPNAASPRITALPELGQILERL
jgi:putative hydrolase of the HAD superfamily